MTRGKMSSSMLGRRRIDLEQKECVGVESELDHKMWAESRRDNQGGEPDQR